MREHQEFPSLRIANYTEQAQFKHEWNNVTRQCRGLIFNADTGEVLARPFPKFFNYGDPDAPQLDPDAPLFGVFDKLDGSLGIGYTAPDGSYRIATRGSFHSDQAAWATEFVNRPGNDPVEYGTDAFISETGYTPLYEIIYPENRIVVDYKGLETVKYLGSVKDDTGEYAPPWPIEGTAFSVVQHFPYKTLREVLESEPRDNAEGFVVWLDELTPVKIKYEAYVALHRIVTGLSRKEIWRQMLAGTYDTWVKGLPDEFYEWATMVHAELTADWLEIAATVWDKFTGLDDGAWVQYAGADNLTAEQRKAFALKVKADEHSGYLFSLLNGRDIQPAIIKSIEPKGKDTYVKSDT